jgi:PPOX class probable F420-dependent enzyme
MDRDQARRLFRDVPIAHLGTIGPDGWPHVVPLWFVWLDDAVYLSSRRGSRTHRNVERNPRTIVQIDRGRAWTELSGILVRGPAETLSVEDPSAKRAMSAWFEKYRGELTGTQFGVYVDQVPEPLLVRVEAERLGGWAHSAAWVRDGG